MANKKSHKKHADNPSQPSKKPVSDAPRSSKTTDPTPPPLPPRTEIVDVTLGYPVFFPLTIPVTMSMLCCMPPGVAKLDFNGHCYNTAVAVGVVCWNMKFSNYVEYYLYDPNDKSETYFNVIQCSLFDTKIPHCYPMGTYVTATGIIVGTTESTFMMALEVSPITERRYNEHVFQARMVKFWCAVDCVSKPVLPDARLFRVSNKFNVEQLRMEIVMKLLAEYPAMARTLALAAASSFAFSPSEITSDFAAINFGNLFGPSRIGFPPSLMALLSRPIHTKQECAQKYAKCVVY